MKKTCSILAIVIFLLTSASFSQEKLITELPKNIESIYGGVTAFQFFYHDADNHVWQETSSKVRIAVQTSFDLPVGTLKLRTAHEFMSNSTAIHFFIHNEWKGLGVDVGYKGMPTTFLHRGNPFTAGGQFEYTSQLSIPGSSPSVNASYKINSLTLYGAFGERPTARKVMIAESQAGLKYDFNSDINFKISGSVNKDVNQYAASVSIHSLSLMVGADNLEKKFGYVDWKISNNVGHVYVDYVNQNNKDSYLEFGQYWDATLYKDVTASIGYGYNSVNDYFYLYSFIHI